MKEMASLSGPRLAPLAGGAPRQLVVLLHGLGSDGADMIEAARSIQAALPHAEFLAPNAPEPCDTASWGYQWFSLRQWTMTALDEGVRRVAPVVDAYLDGLLAERGLTPDRLALVGFSQGTMTALHVALRRPAALGAVVGYAGALLDSGAIPGVVRSRPPVLLVHGDADMVVPFAAMEAAETRLKLADVPVETVVRPGMGHWLDEEAVAKGVAFLAEHLGEERC